MTIRLYQTKLFEETSRDDSTVTGYRLDSHSGDRVGKAITVPAGEVTLTGDDQLCADISTMSEGALLDIVLSNTEYLTDSYYRAFAKAIHARHAELRGVVSSDTNDHDDD